MTRETFAKVTQPVFLGYYYKNEEEQDMTVSVPAMQEFLAAIGTVDAEKVGQAFPNAGAHVITSPLQAENYEVVQRATEDFFVNVLGMTPVY